MGADQTRRRRPVDASWLRVLATLAWDALRFQRSRSALTILGMAVGTASVVAVVSIGLAGRGYVVSLIEGVGSNLVIAEGNGEGVNPEYVTFDDVDALRRSLGDRAMLAPVVETSRTISIAGQAWPIKVLGVTPEYAPVRNLAIREGRFLQTVEEDNAAKVALVSDELARRLYPSGLPDDATVRLFDLRFQVVGVFGEGVSTAAAVNRSEASGLTVMVPYSTLHQLYDTPEVDVVFIRAHSPAEVSEVLDHTVRVLASRHRSMESFQVESLMPFITLARNVSDAIGLVMLAVATVSLLVGGIGIMNIMLVTVRERTRDIGIRLAIGASRSDILTQFLMEAALLSLIGGVSGVLLGAGLPLLTGLLLGITVPISAMSVLVAFVVCLGVGLVFGVHPARRAAGMNIVDSLAHE